MNRKQVMTGIGICLITLCVIGIVWVGWNHVERLNDRREAQRNVLLAEKERVKQEVIALKNKWEVVQKAMLIESKKVKPSEVEAFGFQLGADIDINTNSFYLAGGVPNFENRYFYSKPIKGIEKIYIITYKNHTYQVEVIMEGSKENQTMIREEIENKYNVKTDQFEYVIGQMNYKASYDVAILFETLFDYDNTKIKLTYTHLGVKNQLEEDKKELKREQVDVNGL